MSFPALSRRSILRRRTKLFLIPLLFTIFYLLFTIVATNSTFAQNNYYSPNLNPDVPRDQHAYIQSTLIETMSAVICQLSGVDPIRPNQKCLGVDQKTGRIGFVENGGGAIGVMGTLMSYTFIRPASSESYIKYLVNNFGFPKKTYAQNDPKPSDCVDKSPQGIGFCGIEPLIGIWAAMRNIAYLLFVIIFVLIGLAIMLRVHIDPRTVMSIENQIPRIIVGIILVTFSFAIAGFLIDVMYVAIYLVGGVLVGLPDFPDNIKFVEIATSPTPVDAINRLWPPDNVAGVGGGFFELSTQGTQTFTELVQQAFQNGQTVPTVSAADILQNTTNFLIATVVFIAAFFFILLGLVFATVRLWLILVLAYINILLDITFAPFWFLIGLFPGSGVGVGAWFKDMLANLAVFPTALAMLILGKVFGEIARAGSVGNPNLLFTPPMTGASGNAGSDAFAGLIMLGFIFMTPQVLKITRNAIKAPAINYGPVLQPVGAGAGMIIGSAREFGATYAASKEWIPTGAAGQWEQRNLKRSLLGGVFGRR